MRKHPLRYLWDRLRRSLESAIQARRPHELHANEGRSDERVSSEPSSGETRSDELRSDELRSYEYSSFEMDQELLQYLRGLAEREQRSVQSVAADLLSIGLDQQHASQELIQRWDTLSPRERQVAALVCQNLTNRQIAQQLGISPETVKTYLRHVLYKFGLNSKTELRLLLANWDFTHWDGA